MKGKGKLDASMLGEAIEWIHEWNRLVKGYLEDEWVGEQMDRWVWRRIGRIIGYMGKRMDGCKKGQIRSVQSKQGNSMDG